MIKATRIDIRHYHGNISVFAGNDEESGRVLFIPCDADMIPSASYVPTIRELHRRADGVLTMTQCREIKRAIYRHCCHWFTR